MATNKIETYKILGVLMHARHNIIKFTQVERQEVKTLGRRKRE